MNFLKKILKSLTQVNIVINGKFNSNQTIIHQHGKLIVNGKEVDPESPEGKRVLKQIDQTMTKVSDDMVKMSNQLAEDMSEMAKNLGNMFK